MGDQALPTISLGPINADPHPYLPTCAGHITCDHHWGWEGEPTNQVPVWHSDPVAPLAFYTPPPWSQCYIYVYMFKNHLSFCESYPAIAAKDSLDDTKNKQQKFKGCTQNQDDDPLVPPMHPTLLYHHHHYHYLSSHIFCQATSHVHQGVS